MPLPARLMLQLEGLGEFRMIGDEDGVARECEGGEGEGGRFRAGRPSACFKVD